MNSLKKILIILLVILLTSCENSKTNENAFQIADKYKNNLQDYQIRTFDWLSIDNEFTSSSDDNNDGIIHLTDNYYISDNILYFFVDNWQYINLSIGETLYLCPDPLCAHTAAAGCKYANIRDLVFDNDVNSTLYAIKNNILEHQDYLTVYDTICSIDTENNVLTELYHPAYDVNGFVNLNLMFEAGNELIFSQTLIQNVTNESREIEKLSESKLMSLNIIDGSIENISSDLTDYDYEQFMFASDKYLYFYDNSSGELYVTDIYFKNLKTVLEVGKDNSVRSISYDTNTDEMFIVICSNYIATGLFNYDDKREEGYLYKIDNNSLDCVKIDMPTKKLLYAQITKNYIYYTEYLPIDYGPFNDGKRCIDKTGNKIFRVRRTDTSESELIFDGRSELFFGLSFFVNGDYI